MVWKASIDEDGIEAVCAIEPEQQLSCIAGKPRRELPAGLMGSRAREDGKGAKWGGSRRGDVFDTAVKTDKSNVAEA